jgi:hypothetical protein
MAWALRYSTEAGRDWKVQVHLNAGVITAGSSKTSR